VGLILDTTVLISADRRMLDVGEMLEGLPLTGGDDLAISSISLIEFATGIGRATTQERRDRRNRFVQELRGLLPVISFGADLALRAGLLNGELQKQGIIVGSFDLMIGVTALEMGYGVGTRNIRHFQMITGLRVVEI
jgi:tRNA(fMet)-specific endonuclease VapC